ncbi:MAG: NAD(P)H-hydrate dehydratase [Gammaproteobacteria bacterium]|nr:NAD(P)H-hydrate dehydratase [Gammaproteobacteria bacterium]
MTQIASRAISLEHIQSFFKPRPIDAHKGMFGRILIVGGDIGMPGSVRLAGEGALRVGAGLVTVVTRKVHLSAVVSTRPELLCYGIEHEFKRFKRLLQQATIVVLGPGLGQIFWSQRLFKTVLSANLPMVIDADGLNLLARMSTLPKSKPWILTPHPGEAARLLGTSTDMIQNDRLAAVSMLQQRYGGVVVLKGAGTLISAADTDPVHCQAGNPAMASAGMGDVLSGMMGGLLGQGLSPWEAAQAGVVLHAVAGDQVASKRGCRGIVASDILGALATVVF